MYYPFIPENKVNIILAWGKTQITSLPLQARYILLLDKTVG